MKDRVYNDVRSLAPHLYDVKVSVPSNPITYAWEGGKLLAQDEDELKKLCITKKEYEEKGLNFCIEKFEI